MEAGSTVTRSTLTGLALRRARRALTVADLPEARWALIDTFSTDSSSAEHDSGARSPAASLIEELSVRAGETVGGSSNASSTLEVTDFAHTVVSVGAFIAGKHAGLHDS